MSLVEFESNYEYILGQLQGNVLNFQAMFSSGEWALDELEKIRQELIEAAHTFAAAQGLGGTRLDNATTAVINGKGIDFRNDAVDDYGRYYAGHVEYGHRDRGGGFVAARSFMRPALYTVADASRGRLSGTVERYLNAMWSMSPLQFGHSTSSSGYQRAFYSKSNYMNQNTGKNGKMARNALPNQNPSKVQSSNSNYSVYRGSNSGYSKEVKDRFGWK